MTPIIRRRVNLRDLQYVVRVADLGHFGRAAEACNVSQPTLSGQILKLEHELGVTIFERAGRQIRVTRLGAKIVAEARDILDRARSITRIAASGRDPMIGSLRIGIIPTIAPYLMPIFLPKCAAALPQAPLAIVESITDDLVGPLVDGDLDGAVVASRIDNDRIETVPLFSEPLFVLMPKNHALARHRRVKPDQIDPKSLLLLNEGHCLRDQAIALCRHPEVGRDNAADTRATSLETLLHLTAAGQGVTVAPSIAVAQWSGPKDRLVSRPLAGGTRSLALAMRRDAPRRMALDRLAAVLRDCAPEGLVTP